MARRVPGCCFGTLVARNGLLAIATILAAAILLMVAAVHTQPGGARGWQEFSIGPAHGGNTAINPNAIRSDGMTMALVLSVAYAIPRTRIIGPDWLNQDMFAITAVTPADGSESLRGLLQQELRNRLAAAVHEEEREFAAYVLTAGNGKARLVPAAGRENSNYVHERDLESRQATLADLCGVQQGILGKAVVDETGIAGRYDFTLSWGDSMERTVTEALDTKFGLTLSPAKRRLPALVIDHVERGASVAMLSGMGRMTSRLPGGLRRGVSHAMSVH
jgi:uncharacterized protein (TIGR03435 family)